MADAKSIYNMNVDKFYKDVKAGELPSVQMGSACIIAESLTNSRDAICQSIDALTAAIKESGQ